MTGEYRPVSDVIRERRSVRRFTNEPVSVATVRELIDLACVAPAPHHSLPWRFVHVRTDEARSRLADAMGEAWLADLEDEGRGVHEVQQLLARSQQQLTAAPVLLLACLVMSVGREWPDEERGLAERDMFIQSLGAALQNILLAAVELGLAGYLKGAPLFCAPAVQSALNLPHGWEPAFLVLLGRPEPGFRSSPRRAMAIADVMVER